MSCVCKLYFQCCTTSFFVVVFCFLDVHQQCLRQEFPLNKEANAPYLLQCRVGSLWIRLSNCVTSNRGDIICHAECSASASKLMSSALTGVVPTVVVVVDCTALIGYGCANKFFFLLTPPCNHYNIGMEHIQFKSLPIAQQFQVWARAPIIKSG